MATEKLEGLSLAMCIADILDDHVGEGQISRIFSSAAHPKTEQEFESITDGYTRSYWHRRPQEGKEIARRMLQQGKITFAPVQDCSDGHWRVVSIVSTGEIAARNRERQRYLMKPLRLKTTPQPA